MKSRRTENLTKGKKIIFSLLLLAFSVLLTEMGLQVFYRVTAGQWLWQWWAVPLYESDDFRVYRVKRNLDYIHKTKEYQARYYTNAQGFRTGKERKTISVEKPRNTYRVMHLGPSFTFGWGVDYEQSYAYLISKDIHVPDKRIETINVGTPAQPISYQLAWFKRQGYRYDPDLIIQTVYADCCMNMAMDGNLPEDLPYVEEGYLNPPSPKTLNEATQRVIHRYRRYSASLYFGWRLYVALVAGKETVGIGDELYKKTNAPAGCEPVAILKNYLSYHQFISGALNNDISIVFVHVPLAYVVRPADIIRVKHQGKYKDPLVERLRTKRVQKMLNRNGIHFIDPTEALVQADNKMRMYNLYDIHFTPEGNQVVASTVTPVIQKVIDDTL